MIRASSPVVRPVVRPAVAAGVAALLLVGGCGGTDRPGTPAATGAVAPQSSSPTFAPSVAPPDYGSDPVQFRLVVRPTAKHVPAALRRRYDGLTCPGRPRTVAAERPMVACDRDGFTYLLRPAALVGGVRSAAPVVPPNAEDWSVQVTLERRAAARFASLSARLARVPGDQQLAFVLGGVVVTAPAIGTRVAGGRLQVSGAFTEQDARSIARGLSAGG